MCYGSFTLRETDSDPDSYSDPIPVVGSWDWNLNLPLCSVKTSVYCNVAIRFEVIQTLNLSPNLTA